MSNIYDDEKDLSLIENIILLIKEYPCIYNTKHFNYFKHSLKNDIYDNIAKTVNKMYPHMDKLNGENVKVRWKNVRKSYVNNKKKGCLDNYYLANQLSFLNSFLLEEKNKEKVEEDDEDGGDITFHDVVQNSEISKQKKREVSNVIPPVSLSYKKKKTDLDDMENAVIKSIKQTVQTVQSISEESAVTSTNECYLFAIEEALKEIQLCDMSQCIQGIMNIICSYQK